MRRNIIIGIIIIFLLMIAAVYYFFFRDSSSTPDDPVITEEAIDRPIEEKKLVAISGARAHSPALSLEQDSVWYFDFLGQLFQNDLSGGSEAIFDYSAVQTVEAGLWPDSGNDFILKSSTIAGEPIYTLYQAVLGTLLPLPANIKELAWMPDGKRIVYIWQKDDGSMELQISDSDSTNFFKVADLFKRDTIFPSPSGDYVIVLEPDESEGNKAFEVSLSTGEFTEILDRGRNTGISISPSASKVLFSRINDVSGLPELWLYSKTTGSYQQLNINTATEKVVWTQDSRGFYYALSVSNSPQDPEFRAVIHEDLYFYNLSAGQSALIEPSKGSFPVDYRDMIINSTQDKLFYINNQDGLLYRLNL